MESSGSADAPARAWAEFTGNSARRRQHLGEQAYAVVARILQGMQRRTEPFHESESTTEVRSAGRRRIDLITGLPRVRTATMGQMAKPIDKLQEIGWEQRIGKFDERGLTFLYRDHTAKGQKSSFNQLRSK